MGCYPPTSRMIWIVKNSSKRCSSVLRVDGVFVSEPVAVFSSAYCTVRRKNGERARAELLASGLRRTVVHPSPGDR